MRFNTRSRWNTRRLRCDWTGYARRWVSFYFHIFCKSTNVLVFCVQAIVVLAECWLAMSAAQGPDGIRADGGGVRRDGYAAMAKEALDAHAPALLSRGGLALRARARMAAARAALACRADHTEMDSLDSWDEVLVPLEDAAACCAALGAHAKEAEAYEMTAKVYASMGEKYIGRRNASARKWRECRRKSTRLARIRAGAGGDASVHFGGVGSFPAPRAVAV